MNFTLHIETGNDAMQTGDDVADALRRAASDLDAGMTSGYLRDANGNTVGYWQFA